LPARAVAGGDRDLLAEDRADGELEPLPGAGHSQPRTRRHQRRQGRILAKLSADGEWIGGEVEHAPDPGDDGG
jgi:hypothetical protein